MRKESETFSFQTLRRFETVGSNLRYGIPKGYATVRPHPRKVSTINRRNIQIHFFLWSRISFPPLVLVGLERSLMIKDASQRRNYTVWPLNIFRNQGHDQLLSRTSSFRTFLHKINLIGRACFPRFLIFVEDKLDIRLTNDTSIWYRWINR